MDPPTYQWGVEPAGGWKVQKCENKTCSSKDKLVSPIWTDRMNQIDTSEDVWRAIIDPSIHWGVVEPAGSSEKGKKVKTKL